MYDKDGKLITEADNYGQNMGTYNYASSSKAASAHNKFDVDTYKKWGFYKYYEPRYKGDDDYLLYKKFSIG